MSEKTPEYREVAVTLRFVCNSQEQYDERMAQISVWLEDLRNITEAAEGEMTIELQQP